MNTHEHISPARVENLSCVSANIPEIRRLVGMLCETVNARSFPSERSAVTIQLHGKLRLDWTHETLKGGVGQVNCEVYVPSALTLTSDPDRGARGDFNLSISEQKAGGFTYLTDAVYNPSSKAVDTATVLEPVTVEESEGGLRINFVFTCAQAGTSLRISCTCLPTTVMSASMRGVAVPSAQAELRDAAPFPAESLNVIAETRALNAARQPILTHSFALAVVEKNGKFLLVQEQKPGNPWYLPAGRVELGETIYQAVVRETQEEAGICVAPVGLLRVEHTPSEVLTRAARMRFIFSCRVVGSDKPKTTPDEHSVAAGWFTPEQIEQLHLRHPEVLSIIRRYIRPEGGL